MSTVRIENTTAPAPPATRSMPCLGNRGEHGVFLELRGHRVGRPIALNRNLKLELGLDAGGHNRGEAEGGGDALERGGRLGHLAVVAHVDEFESKT